MDYRLVSFNLCPYVQRSVIALEEKGATYQIEYIDLANKPEWFLAVSPLGKVPVLQVGDEVVFESAVISEFIDETAGGRRLHPEDPLRRAQNRSWIEFTSTVLAAAYKLQMAADEPTAIDRARGVHDLLGRFDAELGPGPFFNGPDFSLVDAAAAPLLQRLTFCEGICRALHLFDGLGSVARWRDALLGRPSVQRSTIPDLRQVFVEYLAGRGSPSRDVEPSWLGRLAAGR